ncbi:cyclic nucleotide-binding domain-containing protein [Marinobacterium arenosum]|uniref:cyclic nucleotide-binding domain-containing protein n=1 Tax=Marinobacterium arenosum TaxID=2862496 RepID=UPI001C94CC40|nr:cyclic nucleotide-binding domain-containing protein [Marinobacterium arenosum]MBY4678970.1 cyclic nucleotide-binding domain-containing protein [Marinobacterium arenosum]
MKTITAAEVLEGLGQAELRTLSTFGALSDAAVVNLLERGDIKMRAKGEVVTLEKAYMASFFVVLTGDIAYYRHCEGRDVLTRHFRCGEQMGFDNMIGMRPCSGVEVATEQSLVLEISSDQFFQFHIDYPADFGLLMINLARELSREIAMLEEVIGNSTGWEAMDQRSEAGL